MIQQVIKPRFIFSLSLLALFIVTSAAATATAFAQQPAPERTPQTYTRPTVLTRPVTPATTVVQPAPNTDVDTPTYQTPLVRTQGALVESLNGQTVLEQAADVGFNPASAIKLATALAALRAFGPQHRFTTAVWTNGTFNKATGTVTGDLIISGRDPSFHYEHAVMIARELNRQGVRTVTGDLIVAPGYTMNFDWSAQRSGEQLYDTLDSTRRPAAATRAWYEERRAVRDTISLQSVPSVAVMGAVYVGSVPARASLLLVHRSSRLVDVLKVLLCYSNNFMAERIGDTLGGAEGVRRFLISKVGLKPAEVQLASTSGLGVNRVTPRAMMKVFRALRDELAKSNLSPSDIMPVAGVDPGTLQKRYTSYPQRGSVIAKTGTLIRTDGGASALVGQMRTAKGETLLFVIFNQRGNVMRFRENQDALVMQLQSSRGGPAAFAYRPLTLSMRLADTELESATSGRGDEYEPADK
jgi:D-alanyl-D-alanine carboxypeptidase/D-alanyl-D-alanine-endopeptidase (penicillin-binding protein 4)